MLEEAENTADEILKEAKLSSSEIGKNIEEAAKKQAESTTEKAKLAINQQKKAAEQDIKTQAVDIAMTAVRKFVSTDLDDKEHRKLIEKYVKEAGSLKA